VRNVMSDLEDLGLIYAPHISAGRLPTEQGLRFFVDAFMETGDISMEERTMVERSMGAGQDHETGVMFDEASRLLSRVSRGAGLVVAPKREEEMKHIEFIQLEEGKALAVLVWESGEVENRIVDLEPGVTTDQLAKAANFLNHHARGRTLAAARTEMMARREQTRSELDELSAALVESGLAVWSGGTRGDLARLIVRGRANLVENTEDKANVARIKLLLDDLERKEEIINLLDLAQDGSGVRIFIGSENQLFSLSGSSLVVAPYRDQERRVVGAIGVIGPTRLNYARIVPVVDYTARMISQMLEKQ
jgi:heat-inducible transcriptional repressor